METQRPLTTVEEKQRWFEQYNNGIHRLGRSWTLVCLIALVGMPFLMGWALDTAPDMHVFWRGFLNVAIIYYPTSVVEYLIYVPMLGSGAQLSEFHHREPFQPENSLCHQCPGLGQCQSRYPGERGDLHLVRGHQFPGDGGGAGAGRGTAGALAAHPGKPCLNPRL